MKRVVRNVASRVDACVEEIGVDGNAELEERYGNQVPVLCINGRKAFKFRVRERELRKQLDKRWSVPWAASRG